MCFSAENGVMANPMCPTFGRIAYQAVSYPTRLGVDLRVSVRLLPSPVRLDVSTIGASGGAPSRRIGLTNCSRVSGPRST